MLTKEKRKEIDELLSSPEDIQEASEKLFSGYNNMLNEIMSIIDEGFLTSKIAHIKKLGEELEGLLRQMRGGEEKKSIFSFFKTKTLSLITFDGTIESKVNKIMQSYKDSFNNIAAAVEMQMTKGRSLVENIQHFIDIEEYLKEKLEKIKRETFEEKVLYSTANSFVKNISKMVVFLKQKKVILEQSVINSITLKGEMAAGMTHFDSMIKDILINASIDNVVKTGANIMEMFRDLIEKYSEYQVKDTIDTASKVASIRQNGAISIKSLNNVGVLIQEANNTYKSLTHDSNQAGKTLEKELDMLDKDLKKFSGGQEDYLTSGALINKK